MAEDFNPDTHILGDDGKVYEKTYLYATGVAAGAYGSGDYEKAKRLQEAMTRAVQKAHEDGLADDHQAIKQRIDNAIGAFHEGNS
jgi:hypothetical protein